MSAPRSVCLLCPSSLSETARLIYSLRPDHTVHCPLSTLFTTHLQPQSPPPPWPWSPHRPPKAPQSPHRLLQAPALNVATQEAPALPWSPAAPITCPMIYMFSVLCSYIFKCQSGLSSTNTHTHTLYSSNTEPFTLLLLSSQFLSGSEQTFHCKIENSNQSQFKPKKKKNQKKGMYWFQ